MDKNSLSHTKWNCKCHLVFAPKYRRQVIYPEFDSWKKYKNDESPIFLDFFS